MWREGLDSKLKKQYNLLIIITFIIVGVFIFDPTIVIKMKLIIYLLCAIIGLRSVKYSLMIFIISYTELFCLWIKPENYSGSFSDFGLITAISCVIGYLLKKGKKRFNKGDIKSIIFILTIIGLLSISIIVAYYRYQQPFIRSFMSFRVYLILLFILPVSEYFKNKNNIKLLWYYINTVIFGISILFIIQKLIINIIVFIPIKIASRGENLRILLHQISPLLCILVLFRIYFLINFKQRIITKIKIILWLSCILYVMFFVANTRIFIITVIGGIFLSVLIFNRKLNINCKISTILFLAAIILLITFYTPIVKNIVTDTFSDVSTLGDNYIRNRAINYYFNEINDNMFLFGGGITNEKFPNSPVVKGIEKHYFLVDIGIFGYYFKFGIFGIIALIVLYFRIVNNLIKTKNTFIRELSLLYIYVLIITIPTVVPFSDPNLVLIIIGISILNSISDYKEEPLLKLI